MKRRRTSTVSDVFGSPINTLPSSTVGSPSLSSKDLNAYRKSPRAREANRVAATKCRKKARKNVAKLQEREKTLVQENRMLHAWADSLRNEVLNLKTEILRHGNCESDAIKAYIDKAAREIG